MPPGRRARGRVGSRAITLSRAATQAMKSASERAVAARSSIVWAVAARPPSGWVKVVLVAVDELAHDVVRGAFVAVGQRVVGRETGAVNCGLLMEARGAEGRRRGGRGE